MADPKDEDYKTFAGLEATGIFPEGNGKKKKKKRKQEEKCKEPKGKEAKMQQDGDKRRKEKSKVPAIKRKWNWFIVKMTEESEFSRGGAKLSDTGQHERRCYFQRPRE